MNSAKIRHHAVLFALLLLGTSAFAQDDGIGKFFGKYVDDPKFTVISISPRMFHLLSKVNWDTIPADLKQTVTGLHSLRILTTESTPGRYFKEAMTLIDRKEYEELITIRNTKENVRFLVKGTGDKISELLMLSEDDDSFAVMSFVGDIDLDKFSRLSADMGIKGMESLKNAKHK
jgi:hypothetical protein